MCAWLVKQGMTDRDWLRLARRLQASRQQGLIARLIAEEQLSNIAIAWRLGITVKTVETHLHRLYKKLDIHCRAQLYDRVVGEVLRMKDGSNTKSAQFSDGTP